MFLIGFMWIYACILVIVLLFLLWVSLGLQCQPINQYIQVRLPWSLCPSFCSHRWQIVTTLKVFLVSYWILVIFFVFVFVFLQVSLLGLAMPTFTLSADWSDHLQLKMLLPNSSLEQKQKIQQAKIKYDTNYLRKKLPQLKSYCSTWNPPKAKQKQTKKHSKTN